MNVTNEVREESITLGTELEGQQFAIKSDAAFFDILSSTLYSYPTLAVIRETITNALDAHKEAGISEPVEVTYSALDSLFIVSDKGNGIPHDKIHEIYCTYGNSTKKDNDSTGGFGLGCKAPFAVTNSFTITNSYGGIKKTYILAKKEGIPEIVRVEGEEACEQSGLTVSIPFKKSIVTEIVKAFVYYSGSNVRFNGQPMPSVKYEDVGMYYVKDCLSLGLLGLNGYGDKLIVRYGSNLYDFNLSNVKTSSERLKSLYDAWESLYAYIDTSPIVGGGTRLKYYATPILNVPSNSLDITPNRESLRYTSKTISTIELFLQKEVDKLKGGLDSKKWFNLFKTNRIDTYLGIDNFIFCFKDKCCITAKDIISQKKDSNLKNCQLAIYQAILSEKEGLFEPETKEFIKYFLDNWSDLFDKTAGYYKFEDCEVVETAIQKLQNFEKPLVDALRSIKCSSFSIGNNSYNIDDYSHSSLNAAVQEAGRGNLRILKRFYKIVVISNYKSNSKESSLAKVISDAYPQYRVEYLIDYIYRVQLASKKKADTLQKELEKAGYFVINVVKENNSPVKRTSRAKDLLNSIKDKSTAFYTTKDLATKLAYCQTNVPHPSLYTCFFIGDTFPSTVLKTLPRYSTYEEIMVPHSNLVSVLKKHEIKSLDEVLFADVKQTLQENPKLLLAMSMLYFSSNGREFNKDLPQLLWFVFQVPELCERYDLPQLTEEELKKLCFINAFHKTFPDYREQLTALLTSEGRVAELLLAVTEFSNYNYYYGNVITYAYVTLRQLQEKGYNVDSRVFTLITSILDSFLLSPKGDDNE